MGQVKDEKYEGSCQDRSDRVPLASSLPLALNFAALGLIFWGVVQLDRPLVQYIRSIHVTWLEQVGDLFYLIGTGGGLVTISILLLAAGYLLKHESLQRSGLESLVAHGVAALIAQTMKHTIGRPRPRMLRDSEFYTGPSFDSGLDSFPSGHASASFAVATVVVKHFPGWARYAYGVAGLIAISRVVRGSHFATDVAGGIVLGVVLGSVIARPLREWRTSAEGAITGLTPWLAVGFAILWTLCRPVGDPVQHAMMVWTGAITVAFGAGTRWGSALRREPTAFLPYATPAIVFGLALTTGSWLVVLIAALIIAARWRAWKETLTVAPGQAGARALAIESAFVAVLVLLILSLQGLKGVLAIA